MCLEKPRMREDCPAELRGWGEQALVLREGNLTRWQNRGGGGCAAGPGGLGAEPHLENQWRRLCGSPGGASPGRAGALAPPASSAEERALGSGVSPPKASGTQPAPCRARARRTPGYKRPSDPGVPRAPRNRRARGDFGERGSGPRQRRGGGLRGATRASALSVRPTAGAAIWWRISVFQQHVVLNVTTGLSMWHEFFFQPRLNM